MNSSIKRIVNLFSFSFFIIISGVDFSLGIIENYERLCCEQIAVLLDRYNLKYR